MKRMIVLLGLCGLVLAGGDAAAELGKLEEAYKASELNWPQRYEAFKARYVAFAKAHPGTPEALDAQLWLMGQAWWLYKDRPAMHAEAGRWAAAILKEHADSPRLEELVHMGYVFSAEQKKELFGALVDSPHASVRAAARFGLKRYQELLDDEYKGLAYRTTTYGAMAFAHLNKHDPSALEEGKVAPEIEGIDHEGKAMKLSDFRGKVVVLDFWGDW